MVAAIANTPVSSKDPSLRHKTTARGLYHAHLSENAGYDEVLLFNELGQATEFCNGALAVRRNGQWLTPDPVQGCLPSTGAAGLGAEKAVILIEELANEREIAFVNALSTHRIVLRVSKTSDAEPAQAPIEIP
jgi:para-aminobenzoate synthetase/4-amino-4-deoxychorismate lyase